MLILLVEDSESDIVLELQVFELSKLDAEIEIARDGQEALDFLLDPEQARPNLIFLDINMPRMDGLTLLKKIKSSDKLKQIPVIMLTTSSSKQDIDEAYMNFANSYIIKPDKLDDFLVAIERVKQYWLETSELPL